MAWGIPIAPERTGLRGSLRQAAVAISDNIELAPAAPRTLAESKAGEGRSEISSFAPLLSYVGGQGQEKATREEAQGVPDAEGQEGLRR